MRRLKESVDNCCIWHVLSINLLLLLVDIVDTKPANMEDLTEVITAARFHPTECGLFVYSSSKGLLRLCDLRSQALCDRSAKGIGSCVCQSHTPVYTQSAIHLLKLVSVS